MNIVQLDKGIMDKEFMKALDALHLCKDKTYIVITDNGCGLSFYNSPNLKFWEFVGLLEDLKMQSLTYANKKRIKSIIDDDIDNY